MVDLLLKPATEPVDPVHSLRVALGIAQNQTLPKLETEHRLTALLALGEPDNWEAQEDMARARAVLQGCRDRIVDLTGALAEAEKVQGERRDADAQKAAGAKREAIRKLLFNRDAAGERLAAALKVVAKEWAALKDANRLVEQAWPPSVGRPYGGGALTLTEAKRLVAAELHRITGSHEIGYQGSLPGAAPPSFDVAQNPGAVPPLTASLGDATAFVMRTLERSL